MKNLAFLLIGLVIGVAINASKSTELQVEFGQCRFSKAQNGTYYDQGMNPHLYLTPRCAEIALGGSFAGSQWGWRAGFIASGSVESRDSRAWLNDGVIDPRPCPIVWGNCQALFGGSGRMQGFSFTLTHDYQLGGKWWARGEGGMLFFRHYFNGYAKPEGFNSAILVQQGNYSGTGPKWEGSGLDQSSKWPGMPIPRIGGQLGYGPVYFSLRYNFAPGTMGLPGHDGSSVTNHAFTEVTVGIALSLSSTR